VDGTGAFISPDQISIILTRFLLRNRPNEKVVYDVKLSFQLAKAVRDAGGVALLERSGHAFLKRRMIEGHCIVGCEASGHYFYRELRGGDDGLFTALLFTEAIATDGSARSLISNVPAIYATPDLRMPNSIVPYALAESRLRARFPEAEQVRVDGCRFDLPCGTVLIRQSVTEPAITMRIEGISREALSQLISECKVAIPEVAALLQVNTDKEIANVGPTEE
jgi:phosphomannomutase